MLPGSLNKPHSGVFYPRSPAKPSPASTDSIWHNLYLHKLLRTAQVKMSKPLLLRSNSSPRTGHCHPSLPIDWNNASGWGFLVEGWWWHFVFWYSGIREGILQEPLPCQECILQPSLPRHSCLLHTVMCFKSHKVLFVWSISKQRLPTL